MLGKRVHFKNREVLRCVLFADSCLSSFSFCCFFQDPKTPDKEIKAHYDAIVKEIEDGFAALTDA